jgi:hypothetical protein
MERVSVIKGRLPIILVAPHGADDDNTAELTEKCAGMLDAYAVINRGFERADAVDVLNDKADCNRVDHCMDDIVYEEYTHYILKYAEEIQDRQDHVYIYHIHGFGNQVKGSDGKPVDIILGYGLGGNVKDSLTCSKSRINHFGKLYKENAPGYVSSMTGRVAVGKGGGKYAARSSNNMNQYFRAHDNDIYIESMQIEIAQRIRANHWADMAMVLSVIFEDISVDKPYNGSTIPLDEV